MLRNISIVIAGDSTVGKTSLLIRYTKDDFYEDYVPTIFDTYSCNVVIGNEEVKVNLQDTAGTESYATFRNMAANEADVILICFAVNDVISFNNVRDKWMKVSNESCPNGIKIIVGTKSDLRLEETDIVSTKKCTELRKLYGIKYIECSAKSGDNIQNVFNTAIQEVIIQKSKNKKSFKCIIC